MHSCFLDGYMGSFRFLMEGNYKPIIVQSDGSILLEVMSEAYEDARDAILPFTELVKSPEYVHTYRITALSIWNAAATGMTFDEVMTRLGSFSRYEIPKSVISRIREAFSRWGSVSLSRADKSNIIVEVRDERILEEILSNRKLGPVVKEILSPKRFIIPSDERGRFKHLLIKMGYPAEDMVGYDDGDPLGFHLRRNTLSGEVFELRQYQKEAVDNFWANGSPRGGQGIVVLPCGSGKTMVGIGVMEKLKTCTLILCTSVAAVRQWITELLDKTSLERDDVGEYTGPRKEIKPVTVTTYQILTYRKSRRGPFEHMNLMKARNWGLLIYDEVHVLPAPVFRATIEIQAKRRLGLTATLIREDGLEEDAFSLIGPKCYDVPWKELEEKGFIAEAICYEIRIPLPRHMKGEYLAASDRMQFRIASENPYKDTLVKQIVSKHRGESILIIGQYINQLKRLSSILKVPLITGSTSESKRDTLYSAFRHGDIPVLVVSKVANFAIDLPDASVAIQVSGTFGSRQEEAQRLGRILRPKKRVSTFYTLVTSESPEENFAHKRQVFLAEQGYRYMIKEFSHADLDS